MAKKTWSIDPAHSEVTFTVRHMVVAKVRGAFKKVSGTIEVDPENPAGGRAIVKVDTASIDTRDEKRDAHLRSPDFFDAPNHPEIVFEGTSVEGSGKKLKLHGNLQMRGVTKPIVLDVENLGTAKDPWGVERALFHAETKLNRKEWGLNWNQVLEAGGFLVGEDIHVDVEVQLVPAQG